MVGGHHLAAPLGGRALQAAVLQDVTVQGVAYARRGGHHDAALRAGLGAGRVNPDHDAQQVGVRGDVLDDVAVPQRAGVVLDVLGHDLHAVGQVGHVARDVAQRLAAQVRVVVAAENEGPPAARLVGLRLLEQHVAVVLAPLLGVDEHRVAVVVQQHGRAHQRPGVLAHQLVLVQDQQVGVVAAQGVGVPGRLGPDALLGAG